MKNLFITLFLTVFTTNFISAQTLTVKINGVESETNININPTHTTDINYNVNTPISLSVEYNISDSITIESNYIINTIFFQNYNGNVEYIISSNTTNSFSFIKEDLDGEYLLDTLIIRILLAGGSKYYVKLSKTNTVSINEQLPSITDFKLYPNPVVDVLNLEFNAENSNDIQIYNIAGQLIETINSSNGFNRITYNTAHLAKGFYIIKIGNTEHKFIKE